MVWSNRVPRAPSLDEGGFKPPDKARRPSGYPGPHHCLLPLYICSHAMQVNKPVAKGVFFATNVTSKEFTIDPGNRFKNTKSKADQIDLLVEGAIVMAHTRGIKEAALMAKEMARSLLK